MADKLRCCGLSCCVDTLWLWSKAVDTFPGGSATVGLVHLVRMACRLVEVEGRYWATTEDRSFFPFF